MNAKPDFLVIGAGVIGLSTALELKRRSPQSTVLVLEKGKLGEGCSYGNAGWLTPCFSMPLPMPGMFLKSLKWLINPESPLYIRPVPTPLLLRWLTRFLLSMNERSASRSIAALTQLSLISLKKYQEWDHELDQEFGQTGGSPFGFVKRGLLMIAESHAGMRDAQDELRRVAVHGVPGRTMSADQIKLMEPALADCADLVGGVYFPEEAHVEPMGVVHGLYTLCLKAGVQFSFNEEVWDFGIESKSTQRVTQVITTRRTLDPGHVILATGSWSQRVGRRVGLNIPLMGGKGYALTLKHEAQGSVHWKTPPMLPIMILEKKIAVTPREDGSTRVAGTLELVNLDFAITPRRVRAIFEGARKTFGFLPEIEREELWRGLRPCTPDGVPMMGPVPGFSNLTLSTGHQMLGLQSAPASGELTAAIALGQKPPVDPAPFSPARLL